MKKVIMSGSKIPKRAAQRKEIKGSLKLSQTSSYRGPIPNAEELQKYEHIQSGFADRILSMAEKEQQASHQLEKETSSKFFEVEYKKIRIIMRGQWFALSAVVLVLIFCAFLAILGDTSAAAWVAAGVLAAIAASFMGIRKSKEDKNS